MILLKKLTLKDFLSHSGTVIDFGRNEKSLVDGSSGAGKSSVFEAIVWSIYGVSRTDNRSLVRKGQKTATVTLDLLRDEEVISITRTATTSGKHTLAVSFISPTGERVAHPLTGIRPLQEWIEKELIGASWLLFINSIAYVQGNTESFVAQTAPKRKELLLEIVKAEDYKKYYENARQRLAELDNDHSRLSGQIIELEANLAALGARLEGKSEHIKTIADNTELLKVIEPKIKELEGKSAEMSALLKTVNILDGMLQSAVAEQEKAGAEFEVVSMAISDEDVESLSVRLSGLRTSLAEASANEERRNEVLRRKPVVTDRNAEINRITDQIEKIKKQPVCPSREKCPYSGDYQAQVDNLMKQRTTCDSLMLDEAMALANWASEEAGLPSSTDIRAILSKINKTEREIASIGLVEGFKKALEEKVKQVMELRKKKEEAEKSAKIDEINTVDNDLLSCRSEQKGLNDNVVRATAALESIDRDEKEIISLGSRKSVAQNQVKEIQEEARKVGLVKEAFSSRGGIESMVLDILIPKLEDRINEFLGQMSDFRIRIDTQRKSADGESMVEGLYLFIANENGEEMDLANYSGGEKLRVGVSVTEGLASLTKSVGFRLMDEAIFGLSPEMIQDFSMVLSKLQMKYPQILAISHLQEIKDLFEQQIRVVKRNSVSSIVDKQ